MVYSGECGGGELGTLNGGGDGQDIHCFITFYNLETMTN